jgi:NADH dehydrogenase (ubiquinone) Fe-S protein 8
MATLARARPQATASAVLRTAANPQFSRVLVASFSNSARAAALPAGPPPAGYRIPKTKRWDDAGEMSALDKTSNRFLLTEMVRGMWVVLEQFFRAPYASSLLPFA